MPGPIHINKNSTPVTVVKLVSVFRDALPFSLYKTVHCSVRATFFSDSISSFVVYCIALLGEVVQFSVRRFG